MYVPTLHWRGVEVIKKMLLLRVTLACEVEFFVLKRKFASASHRQIQSSLSFNRSFCVVGLSCLL